MKLRFAPRPPPFQSVNVEETIDRALASAGLQTASGPLREVTETIRRALSSAGLAAVRPAPPPDDPGIVDVMARERETPTQVEQPSARARPVAAKLPAAAPFLTRSFSNAAGTRSYKLYVPQCVPAGPMPMLVMLHGCTQSSDDFATGTRMNLLAEELGFAVVYPEQASAANVARCWNWFSAQDQQRDSGEPSLIAGITRQVASECGIDEHRIFVAGLSAGGAMAVVMGETYPELYAGVGVHSGLPYASAHDIPSAMATMKASRDPAAKRALHAAGAAGGGARHAVSTIVFHGDRDHTVQHMNGGEIVRQAVQAHEQASGVDALQVTIQQRGRTSQERASSRTVHVDAQGRIQVESWVIHGAGHAWAGGDPSGSYTDTQGPDASREMLRFFLDLQREP